MKSIELIKKALAVILCLTLCISLASCIGDPDNSTTTEAEITDIQETDAEEPETDEAEEETSGELAGDAETEAGTEATTKAPKPYGKFTLDDVYKQNRVSVLLKEYDTVSCKYVYKDGRVYSEEYYFSFKGYPISVSHHPANFGDPDQCFYTFNKNYLDFENGKLVMDVYSGPEDELEDYFDTDWEICMHFDMGADYMYDVKEGKDTYTFRIGYDGGKHPEDIACTVSKYDLSIREVKSNVGTDSETVTTFVYNGEVKDFGLTKGWDKKDMRKVKIISEVSSNGNVTTDTVTMTVPYNVEVRPYSYYEYNLWANEGYTKEYKYPGDGVDYVVYYTNIMG